MEFDDVHDCGVDVKIVLGGEWVVRDVNALCACGSLAERKTTEHCVRGRLWW